MEERSVQEMRSLAVSVTSELRLLHCRLIRAKYMGLGIESYGDITPYDGESNLKKMENEMEAVIIL